MDSTHIFLAPDGLLNENGGTISLKHPKSNEDALFYWNKKEHSLLEIQRFSEAHRSWLIKDRFKKDGSFYFCTPIDALFLIIPELQKLKEKFTTIDCLLPREMSFLSQTDRFSDRLQLITDHKVSSAFEVYRLNEERLLKWLQNKVRSVKNLFSQAASLDCEGFQDNENDYNMELSFGIVSDYLSKDLSTLLASSLGIELEKKAPIPVSLEEDLPPSKRRSISSGPLEDYTHVNKDLDAAKKTNVKAKKVIDPNNKAKSIASFFNKKVSS